MGVYFDGEVVSKVIAGLKVCHTSRLKDFNPETLRCPREVGRDYWLSNKITPQWIFDCATHLKQVTLWTCSFDEFNEEEFPNRI